MPAVHRDVRSFAELLEALILVVDQRFQRRQVQHLHPDRRRGLRFCPRVVSGPRIPFGGCGCVGGRGERRQDRQERRLGLPGGGCCGDDDVSVAIEDRADRTFLGVVQRCPPLVVYPTLHSRMQP